MIDDAINARGMELCSSILKLLEGKDNRLALAALGTCFAAVIEQSRDKLKEDFIDELFDNLKKETKTFLLMCEGKRGENVGDGA